MLTYSKPVHSCPIWTDPITVK